MLKTIFFDFDGVLTLDGSGSVSTCKYIQQTIPDVPLERVLNCYREKYLDDLITGKVTHADIWPGFCHCLGKKLDSGILEKAFRQTPVNVKMLNICRKLQRNYRLGIITNNSIERIETVQKSEKLKDLFDYTVISAAYGATKDCEIIFNAALSMADCQASECSFIDNKPDNLVIPKRLGFHTFWHDHHRNNTGLLLQEFKRLEIAF